MEKKFKYYAFISYSHLDKKWANWLHKSLETYKVPQYISDHSNLKTKRIFPVFLDNNELPASSDLGTSIHKALKNSHFLIVICSPNSRASRWVSEEILSYKRLGGENRILCLIVDGEPHATDNNQPTNESFSEALKFKIGSDGNLTDQRINPIAADVRKDKDGKENAKLKVLAGILGINLDLLKQRDQARRMHRLRIIVMLSLILAGAMLFLSVGFYKANLSLEKSYLEMGHQLTKQFALPMAETILSDDLLGLATRAHLVTTNKLVNYSSVTSDENILLAENGDIPSIDMKQKIFQMCEFSENNNHDMIKDHKKSIIYFREFVMFQELLVACVVLGIYLPI